MQKNLVYTSDHFGSSSELTHYSRANAAVANKPGILHYVLGKKKIFLQVFPFSFCFLLGGTQGWQTFREMLFGMTSL